ncbi:MAG: AbrB/MazE/SpoVT family DNA-binding domain-containing protein [Rubrobacteraceae bacterium]
MTVTRKGQVTIPVEVRRKLGVREGDKVVFRMEEGEVKLVRGGSVVERTAGAIKNDMPIISAEEERRAAEEAIAEAAVKRMGG